MLNGKECPVDVQTACPKELEPTLVCLFQSFAKISTI